MLPLVVCNFPYRQVIADVVSNVVNSTLRKCVMNLNILAIWILALAVGFIAFVTPKPAAAYLSYERGNRGYEATSGSKDQFKASYRPAYIQGYERAITAKVLITSDLARICDRDLS
jgi:hypothetical protein